MVEADPDHVNAYIGLGNVYFDKARFYFLPQLPPSSQKNLCGMPSADAYFDLAAAQRARGDIYSRQLGSASDAEQAVVNRQEALAAYMSAYASYRQCLEQKIRSDGGDPTGATDMQTTIECPCKEGERIISQQSSELGGASG